MHVFIFRAISIDHRFLFHFVLWSNACSLHKWCLQLRTLRLTIDQIYQYGAAKGSISSSYFWNANYQTACFSRMKPSKRKVQWWPVLSVAWWLWRTCGCPANMWWWDGLLFIYRYIMIYYDIFFLKESKTLMMALIALFRIFICILLWGNDYLSVCHIYCTQMTNLWPKWPETKGLKPNKMHCKESIVELHHTFMLNLDWHVLSFQRK